MEGRDYDWEVYRPLLSPPPPPEAPRPTAAPPLGYSHLGGGGPFVTPLMPPPPPPMGPPRLRQPYYGATTTSSSPSYFGGHGPGLGSVLGGPFGTPLRAEPGVPGGPFVTPIRPGLLGGPFVTPVRPGPGAYHQVQATTSTSSFRGPGSAPPLFRTPQPIFRTPQPIFRTPQPPQPQPGFSGDFFRSGRDGGGGGGRRPLYETPMSSVSHSATPSKRRRTTPTSCTSSKTSGLSQGSTSTDYSSALGEPLDRHTVLAVVEGRGQARGEMGIACMNLRTPNLILCQFTDTQSYLKVISKVNIFRPLEILMPAMCCDVSSPSQLYVQLKKAIGGVQIVPIQRRIFNEAKGLQKLMTLAAPEFTPVVHSVTNKYYCLSACSALLKYVELVQSMMISSRSLRVEFQGSDQTCMIDHVTAQHLELLVNVKNPMSGHCVFGIVNDCRTPLGARMLRMNILQPPCDEKLINGRLDSIENLMNEREALYGLQDILGRLPIDIEHVIASLIQIPKIDNVRITEQRINYIIALKHTLELLPAIVKLFQNTTDEYFLTVKHNLMAPEFDDMLEKIKRVIQEEAQFQRGSANMKRQRCFAVKASVNPILDVARQAYCEIVEEINNYVVDLSQALNMTLRLGSNNQRGYYIQHTTPGRSLDMSRLPHYVLQVKKRGNVVTFTTEMLISSDHRAKTVLKEIESLTGRIIAELITSIRADIGTLFKVSEAIGHLDLIYSLANYSLTTPRCVRPTYSENATSVTMGRHPILDSISSDPAVPNNAFFSNDVNFMLLTGPNMSGKTTYIKQVAALQVLAQIGCFVPAEAATFRIASNILSRIGSGDKIEENSSSFAVELNEMTYILQNANANSLIVIDELGRATSVEEGTAMAWAMAEELLKTKAYVLFATHHMFLTKLESLYINALNYTMEAREWERGNDASTSTTVGSSRLQYSHVIKRGVTDVENYGLKFAMSTSYPKRVIENAMRTGNSIREERGNSHRGKDAGEIQKVRDEYLLGSHICLFVSNMDIDDDEADLSEVNEYLKGLSGEFAAMTGNQRGDSNGLSSGESESP